MSTDAAKPKAYTKKQIKAMQDAIVSAWLVLRDMGMPAAVFSRGLAERRLGMVLGGIRGRVAWHESHAAEDRATAAHFRAHPAGVDPRLLALTGASVIGGGQADGAPQPDDRATALKNAIRAITVEMPDDEPNGEAERQLLRLEAAVEHLTTWAATNPAMARRLSMVSDAAAKLCAALADDTKALREAAEAYFGVDFKAPDEKGADA